MALPARILLKNEPTPAEARATLFRLIRVDGIINGTNLSDTPVWPKMNQPWMLMFGRNERPQPRHAIYFVTLALDGSLNKTGLFHIDSESARPIEIAMAKQKPWLWKALSVGTMLDVDIVGKMNAASGKSLDESWRRIVGKGRNGKGYQIAETQKKLRSCKFLQGLPNLDSTDLFRFVVDPNKLEKFTRSRVWRRRKSTIYDPPLVLIKEAPGENRTNGRALLAFQRIAYNESFNGYSGAGHPNGELLVRYVHLFVHSVIWEYYLLVTSPAFAAERRRARKSDLGKCPFMPFEALTDDQRKELIRLSKNLEIGTAIMWEDIDAFFARLYGLQDHDLQVIQDTLSVAMPYETARARACKPPTEQEKRAFVAAVKKPLAPLVPSHTGKLMVERIKVSISGNHLSSPFEMLLFAANGKSPVGAIADGVLEKIIQIAHKTGATQIVIPESGSLVVGIYNQYRYWTLSRARLLAGDVMRYHLDMITG